MCHPAVYIAMAGYNMIQARATKKAEIALADQAYRDRQEQIKDNRMSVQLEAAQKGNTLTQIFVERQASNRALLSPSGIGQSNSLEAAMKFNKSQYMRELNISALNAIKQKSELAYKSKESGLTKTADITRARTRYSQSMMDSLEMGMKGAEGLKKKPPAELVETDRIMGGLSGPSRPRGAKY
jgi:hypothetical protein